MTPSSQNASSLSYRGNRFTLDVPGGWADHTIHSLEVPTAADRPHRITVQTISDVEASSLEAFARPFIEAAERSLREGALIELSTVRLGEPPASASGRNAAARRNGHRRSARPASPSHGAEAGPSAQRALLRYATEGAAEPSLQLQLFLLGDTTGLVTSASFSAVSWRTAGPQVERVMRSIRFAL